MNEASSQKIEPTQLRKKSALFSRIIWTILAWIVLYAILNYFALAEPLVAITAIAVLISWVLWLISIIKFHFKGPGGKFFAWNTGIVMLLLAIAGITIFFVIPSLMHLPYDGYTIPLDESIRAPWGIFAATLSFIGFFGSVLMLRKSKGAGISLMVVSLFLFMLGLFMTAPMSGFF